MHLRILALLTGLAGLALTGCGGSGPTPEDRIRALIAEAEQAAETRDLRALKELVSPEYGDAAERDRRAVLRLAAGYFLRHQSIHLLTRITEVRVEGPERARAELYLAVAGRPIADLEALIPLRADLYRVGLVMGREDGTWRVTSARWERADRQRILEELLE